MIFQADRVADVFESVIAVTNTTLATLVSAGTVEKGGLQITLRIKFSWEDPLPGLRRAVLMS